MQETPHDIRLFNICCFGLNQVLLKSVEHLTSPDGLNMSPKRITVSTAGIAKMIRKLADDGVKFNLALSLHAADDKKRDEIMPINEHNNLEALIEALSYFYRKTKNKISYEYIAFENFNEGEVFLYFPENKGEIYLMYSYVSEKDFGEIDTRVQKSALPFLATFFLTLHSNSNVNFECPF